MAIDINTITKMSAPKKIILLLMIVGIIGSVIISRFTKKWKKSL